MAKSEILLEAGTNELEIIEFYIDEVQPGGGAPARGYYGINVAKVLEVIESPRLQPQEAAVHPCFLGTIPLRDLILPVLDLGVWLNIDKAPSNHEVILVTEFNKTITGFLVSGVTQIHRVSWSDVKPPSHYLTTMEENCITAMVEFEDHFVLLLDLEKILLELDPGMSRQDGVEPTRAEISLKALIVDDSTTLRYIIKGKLEDANFKVDTLNDGEQAWQFLQNLKARAQKQGVRVVDLLDILISDIEMPRMDGYALTKRIKEDPVLKDLPVMLFSSMISKELRHKGESVGADDQVSKPEFVTLAQRSMDLISRNRPLAVHKAGPAAPQAGAAPAGG